MSVSPCRACLYTMDIGGQKKAPDPLERKLEVVVSHHVGAGTEPRISWP